MLVPIKIANFLAKYSCSKWNSSRIMRLVCRRLYHGLASTSLFDKDAYVSCSDIRAIRNTYPWPYRDERFAGWPEEKGALVSDQARMVVKHATSYCAWKIKETTGFWPNKPIIPKNPEHAAEIAGRPRPHDAKYWGELLEAQGYRQTSPRPDDHRHYVGIDPDFGEYGVVVWFEHLSNDLACVMVSSYIDKQFWYGEVLFNDFAWYEII